MRFASVSCLGALGVAQMGLPAFATTDGVPKGIRLNTDMEKRQKSA